MVLYVRELPQRSVALCFPECGLNINSSIARERSQVLPSQPPTRLSSMAHLTLPVASALVLVLYFVWRLLRNYIVSSPLDKIPGPPSGSVITGALYINYRWLT